MRQKDTLRRNGAQIVSCILALAAATAWFPAASQAAIIENENCYAVCTGNYSCDWECKHNNVWKTCGEYFGRPANDLDGDGVVNTSDNCLCTSNSSQANCDSDSFGDACDPTDNSWSLFQQSIPTCHVDVDDHVWYETMEFYRKDVYKSNCTGQTCVKDLLITSFNCIGSADMSCCTQNWLIADCNLAWNIDSCGTPKCSF